jgi:hypothetical protein
MSRESSMGIEYERMAGDAESFDASSPGDSFVDPFANTGSSPEYDNLPMSAADYGSSAPSGDAYANSSSDASVSRRDTSGLNLAQAIHAGSLAMPAFSAPRESKQQLLSHERRSLWGQCSYNIGKSISPGPDSALALTAI